MNVTSLNLENAYMRVTADARNMNMPVFSEDAVASYMYHILLLE